MQLINGTVLADTIKQQVAHDVQTLPEQPRLGVLLVGDDPASHLYVRLKREAAERAGIALDIRLCDASISDDELVACINAWNADPHTHAILVQLPLPAGHDETRVIGAIDPVKDVDGFHVAHLAAWETGTASIIPPVHEGVLRLINATDTPVNLARVTIIANSEIFAKPLAHLLKTAGAFVSVMSADALDPATLRESDIVITAVGKPGLITSPMVKNTVVLIDVGTTKLPNGKVVGDVDRDSFIHTEAWISPVPGGVGPMTIAQLLMNVVRLCRAQTASS